jgi:histone-binding protein RBBP4
MTRCGRASRIAAPRLCARATRGARAALTRRRPQVQALRWRTLTPLLYDWLATTNRSWPSLTCRWGPPAIAFNASAAGGTRSRQRLYWSEQTDGSAPNTLIAANVDVVLPRCASAESVVRAWGDGVSSSTFRKGKTVYHPGEVNKIREVHGVPGAELVVTHSDCPEVYLWNLATQPDRAGDARHDDSRPDCVLTGHTALAEFALATAAGSPAVASGGKDRAVCLWHLKDADGSLRLLEASVAEGGATAAQAPAGRSSLNSGGLGGLASTPPPAPKLACRARFEGHNDTVEDVAFHPNSDEQLCSVGDDSAVCFWDARAGTAPVIKARAALAARAVS